MLPYKDKKHEKITTAIKKFWEDESQLTLLNKRVVKGWIMFSQNDLK